MLLAGTSPRPSGDCHAHACTVSPMSPWKKLMPPRAESSVPLCPARPAVHIDWGCSGPFPKPGLRSVMFCCRNG